MRREGEQARSSGTLVEERVFLVHLADVPEDVVLVAVALNGHQFQLRAGNASGFAIAEVLHGNNTRGYALTVPFDHPAVRRQVEHQQPLLGGSFSSWTMMKRVLVLQAGRSRAVRGDDPLHPARSP